MRVTTKILIAGITCAALLTAAGAWRKSTYSERLAALVEECEASPAPWDQFKDSPAPPPGFVLDPLVCEPSELRALGETHGLQNRIVEASYAAASADEAFHLLAMIVATLCAVPWGWYFLLRRLGELRAALAGNVPDR